MKRLLQALNNKIYPGDVISKTNAIDGDQYKKHFRYTVNHVSGDGSIIAYIENYSTRGVSVASQAAFVKKEKAETFKKEWNKIFFKEPAQIKPHTLRQLCTDKNIGYLYEELGKSKDNAEFKLTMDLINRMLNNGVR